MQNLDGQWPRTAVRDCCLLIKDNSTSQKGSDFHTVDAYLQLSHFISGCTDLDPLLGSTFSHHVEFGDNEHADRLVKARAHTQALLVGAPVQASNWLSGQSGIL